MTHTHRTRVSLRALNEEQRARLRAVNRVLSGYRSLHANETEAQAWLTLLGEDRREARLRAERERLLDRASRKRRAS